MNDLHTPLEDLINEGRIRPPAGTLWAEKIVQGGKVKVEGLGEVGVSHMSPAGLLVVSNSDREADTSTSNEYIVRRVGADPIEGWKVPAPDAVPSEANYRPGQFDRWTMTPETWESQGISEGVVVSSRAINGAQSDMRLSSFVQLTHREICAIGVPLDYPDPDVIALPAPGWVFLNVEVEEYDGLLDIGHESMGSILELGPAVTKATVALLPQNDKGGLTVGDTVLIPRMGTIEFVDFDTGHRAMNQIDILAVWREFPKLPNLLEK